jgi:hypothetical protein
MAQSLESDQPQPPARTPAPETSLFSRSGFMDGLNNVRHKASDLAGKVVQKGHDLANSETGQKIKTQAAETTHQVLASPITKSVVNSAEKNGKQELTQGLGNAKEAYKDGKSGNYGGALLHGLPVVAEVGAPLKVLATTALKIGADQLPASQRGTAAHITEAADVLNGHGLAKVGVAAAARVVESQAVHEVKQKAVQTALESTQHQTPKAAHLQTDTSLHTATSANISTADFLQALKKKIEIKQAAQKQAGSN